MTTAAATEQAEVKRSGMAESRQARLAWLAGALVLLGLVVIASIAIGAKDIAPSTVIDALFRYDNSNDDHAIIMALRLPRTVLGLLVGIALGLAGALIQALSRNPLADPGILGVNAGAAFAVSIGIGFFGASTIGSFIWFAFAGAVGATVLVYAIGSVGRGSATPIRLTLAGIAITAVLTGLSTGMALLDPQTFDRMRFWMAGSLTAPGTDTISTIVPFIVGGVALAFVAARSLNAVALGDDLAAALGADVMRTRVVTILAVTLLAGSATAACGPIAFLGLMVPHIARWIIGADQRWITIFTLTISPIILLTADVIGRIAMRPGELQVGIVTAFVGAPVLIFLARRRKVSAL